ncbi:unnamed protein product [Rhodiola kirilowii]
MLSIKVLKIVLFVILLRIVVCRGQDYEGGMPVALPPAQDTCDGIFLSYNFISREKVYPHVKNATAQAWAFKAMTTVLNTGIYELKAWKIFIGFQHQEILVSASGAVLMDGMDLPAAVGNGTYLAGYPQVDLETAIDTAGDLNQIQARIELTGTQFGVKPPGIPMPKTIKLENDGYKCPAPTKHKSSMYACCVRDKKKKAKQLKTKYFPRQDGDLSISYDITQAYESSYLAQVTIENFNPLGRLDNWNLTWEWMRGEFIYTMRGAYTHMKDVTGCIYGEAGQYYQQLDFSQVMNCEKKPVIGDLPPEKAKDKDVGNIPYCCRNGTLLPVTMDPSKSKSIFQVQVYKIPPDMNRTAIYPPEKWKIYGVLNPTYKCGPPVRVDATLFPDPSGLQAMSTAIASWQIVCNITRVKKTPPKCCVSFSAYYNDSVVPCNTCACGCEDTSTCSQSAPAMLLPPEGLLVPFDNRTAKAKAWAKLKHFHIPKPLPCGDNCGVSVNWHISTDYKSGWTARITLFNWEEFNFVDWFTAIQIKKAYKGYENVYSFNGTILPDVNHTIFMQGLPGLNYLVGEVNGTHPASDPRVPGKQQSVISFRKKNTPKINILKGDGFPTKVFFNGEECALPTRVPIGDGARQKANLLLVIILSIMSLYVLFLVIQATGSLDVFISLRFGDCSGDKEYKQLSYDARSSAQMPIFKNLVKTLIRKSPKTNRTFFTTAVTSPSPFPLFLSPSPSLSSRTRLSTLPKWVFPFSGPLFLSATPWKLSQSATPLYLQCDVVLRTKVKALNLLETAWCLPTAFRIPESADATGDSPDRVQVAESNGDGVGKLVQSFVNLPNFISMSRLISGPALGWMIVNEWYTTAFVGLAISGATDWLDGYVARKMNINSVVGSYLDPLADKVLIGCVAVAMVHKDLLHPGLVAIVLLRDVALVGGAVYQRANSLGWKWNSLFDFFNLDGMRPHKVEPLFLSKVNTVFQLLLVAAALLQPEFGTSDTQSYITYLSWLVAFTTVASTGAYGVQYMKKRAMLTRDH